MMYLWRLLRRTFDVSVGVMLIYRANVVFFLIFEVMFLLAQFLTVHVGFRLSGGTIAGWTEDQVYLLTAINGLSHQLFICFFINSVFNLGMQVWNGQFDYILLKPLRPLMGMWVHGQFVISNIPTTLLNFLLLIGLIFRFQVPWSLLPVFALLFLLGLAVRVAFALICISPVFFSERLGDVEDSFWSVTSLARYPLAVYPRSLATFLTFILPIGILASVPAEVLNGKRLPEQALAALAAGGLFVLGAVAIFNACLKRYQSVNSGV